MLEAARAELERDARDVVVGIVSTHARYDTAALLLGLELLPRERARSGSPLDPRTHEELDLDAALKRAPALLLVDELAHENRTGARHKKRWQDVQELLDAGINVYTTLDVQQLESLSDVVGEITGSAAESTVPDSVLDEAHELRLIDLSPDELLERFKRGKASSSEHPTGDAFFRKGNLLALRELALRRAAERVDTQLQDWRARHNVNRTWA